MRQRGPGDTDHAEHVDVEDPAPLVDRVGLDRALGADARVVHQDVDAAELPAAAAETARVTDSSSVTSAAKGAPRLGRGGRIEVEDGHRRAAGEGSGR